MSFAAYALEPTDIEGLSGRIGLTVTLVLTVRSTGPLEPSTFEDQRPFTPPL